MRGHTALRRLDLACSNEQRLADGVAEPVTQPFAAVSSTAISGFFMDMSACMALGEQM